MDGVLIESEPYHIKAEIEVFRKHGVMLTQAIASEYLGYKLDDYITALAQRFNTKLDHAVVMAELQKKIEAMYMYDVPLVPYVASVLSRLNKTFKLALATSREEHLARAVLKRLGVADFFEVAVYREDVRHGKPSPEVFLTAAKRLGVEPSACVVIEDAQAGFLAGKQAGMFVIARKAEHNKDQDFSDANEIVTDLSKLPALLKRL